MQRRADQTRIRARKGGFTLIEMAIAMSILVIGAVAAVSATSRLHSLKKATRENTIAQNALRGMSERIHSKSYFLADANAESWAQDLSMFYAPGGEYGNEFDVRGLAVDEGEVSIGTIQILTDETLADADLGFQVGMPRDLNGNGTKTDVDVSGSARILPVLLTLHWRGQNGTSEIKQGFFVTSY